jgi:uncharacterized ubiquitin-like protein YukD
MKRLKYVKLFEDFNKVSWNENSNVDIDGIRYNIKWKVGELELSEVIQAFSQRKNLIPKEWNSFKSIFEGKYPEEFSHQRDTKPNDFNIGLKSPYKSGNVGIKYTTFDILEMDKLTIEGKEVDAKPYHDFIKMFHKIYWAGTKKMLSDVELKKLAEDVGYEEGRPSFVNILYDDNYLGELKKYFDKVIKSEENPNGIPLERFGTEKVKVDYPNFWNDYYPKALDYYEYFQKTFDFVGSSVKGGKEIAMPSVIKIGNKMLLLGGNRRMTYCIINNVLPSVHYIYLDFPTINIQKTR